MQKLSCFFIILSCLFITGCSQNLIANMNNEDNYILKVLFATPHKQEALSWLQQKDGKEYSVGEGSNDMDAPASLRFVQDLYQRGAVAVTAIDIETDTYMETTSTLIVKLPQDVPSRTKVFQVEAKIAKQGGFEGSVDQGQEISDAALVSENNI